ncbi:MAG: SO2930 family diheme c-type cytochrome [Rhizobiaceae bacterium]
MVAKKIAAFLVLLLLAFTPAAAQPSADAIVAAQPPKLLSEFSFFDDLRGQKPTEGVVPFALATPLFSDGALKYRFVHLPPGMTAQWSDTEAFEFPVGSALIKTFAFPADYRQPDKDIRLIETRVMLRQEKGWQAWAYVWNDEQSDAALKIAGAKVEVSSINAAGEPLGFTYSVPNKNQCKGCHAFNGEIVPLGPKARNLNRPFPYAEGEENQLAHWTRVGILAGAADPAGTPVAADMHDASLSIDERARTWLDVNCAHCHRREGPASNSGLFLTRGETDPVALGIGKRPVAAGKGSGGRSFDIAPGDPDGSIMLYRVESIEPGVMMPELGRHVADPEAGALLREWIAQLK